MVEQARQDILSLAVISLAIIPATEQLMTHVLISSLSFFLAITLLGAEPGAFEEKAGKFSLPVEGSSASPLKVMKQHDIAVKLKTIADK